MIASRDTPSVAAIDLRSDFLVRPSPQALAAMQEAARQSSAFGLREDGRQRALEARVACLLGKEDALVFPTCTMANQVAVALHTRPGDIVLTPYAAHAATSEAGAAAALSGVRVVELPGSEPAPAPATWAACLGPADEQRSRVTLFIVENTHNRAGGIPNPPGYNLLLAELAGSHGIRMHLDGARLLHAAVALDTPPAALAAGFDTVAISLNKGLGGMIGAALAGSREAIARALMLRQRMGGGLRAIGPFAAGTEVALGEWRSLAGDHRRAERLASGLSAIPGLTVLGAEPRTTIVVLQSDVAASSMCAVLADRGVLGIPFGANRIRLVVHRDIDDDAIIRVIAAARDGFAAG